MSIESRSQSNTPPPEGHAYAWGRTARVITESHFLDVLHQIPNFTAVDLCSAFPFYSHIMKGRHKADSYTKARSQVGRLFHIAFTRRTKMEPHFPSIKKLDDKQYLSLKEELEDNEDVARQLLRAPVFELLYNPPQKLVGPQTEERTKMTQDYIKERLLNSSIVYTPIREAPREHADEGWHFIFDHNMGSTFRGMMKKIMDESLVEEFIGELSKKLAENLTGGLHTFKMISVDKDDFSQIRKDAKRSFPKGLRRTFFYRSAREPGSHIQADIRNLPFPRESISFFSCIEGWPFYFAEGGIEKHLEIADTLMQLLQKGGRAVLFPWRIQGQTDAHEETLHLIESFWREKGMTVSHDLYGLNQLQEGMSDREYMLVDHSPVFKEPCDEFSALILAKPL